jgi:hypothetical protein
MKSRIENAGKLAVVVALGFITGVFCFLLWAVLERGAQ